MRARISRPVVLAASVLLLAACGSTAASSSGAGPSAAATASASASLSAGYHPVTDYVSYIGGHAGPANSKLSTVDIGAINQQGGSADIAPQWTIGARLAADFINTDGGGIDGHPVKLVTCFIPDQVANAAQCGEQMANDTSVQAVSIGPVAIGSEAMESAIEATGKVMAFSISVSQSDVTAKNTYVLFGDGTHVEAPLATFAKQYLHAKKVSILYENVPGASEGAEIIASALRYEGVTTKVVGYDPSTTDLTGPVIADGVQSADVFIADAPNGQVCSAMYLALKKLNITIPVLGNGPCVSQQAATGDGGQLPPDWYYAAAGPLPGDPVDGSYAAYGKVARQFNEGQWADDSWAAKAFGETLTVAKWEAQVLREGKPLTAANINAAAKAYKGATPMGGPSLICGTIPHAPAVCNDKDTFYQNTKPGVFIPVAWWLGPPPGYQIPAADV